MLKKGLVFLSILLFSQLVVASIDLGIGISSSLSGRAIPALAVGTNISSYKLSVVSVGVQTSTYYQSNYVVNLFKTWKAGSFIFGEVEAGFGAGVFYTAKGFQDTGGGALEEKTEFGIGPSLQMKWFFAGPIYFNIEAVFGLRDLYTHAMLNFQDVVNLSIGASF